ncbi:MAG: hypothetical protein H0W63_03880 [Gemmatimonadaceae bacterium]|nr:hypothetical protein [Gemmatimonadaceae bacterium]
MKKAMWFQFSPEAGLVRVGWIAQDVEKVCPGLVEKTEDRKRVTNKKTGEISHRRLRTTTREIKYSVAHMKAFKALGEALERIEAIEAAVFVQ